MTFYPDEPEGVLGGLPPECDPPLELPDMATASAAISRWHDNVGTLSPAMESALIALLVADGVRMTLVGNLPEPVLRQIMTAVGHPREVNVRLGYAAVVSLARFIDRRAERPCACHLALEAARLCHLAMSGHVRSTLRRQHPAHAYWRAASVDVLFTSRSRVFSGEAVVSRRLLDRVAAVDTAEAERAMAAGLTGRRSP